MPKLISNTIQFHIAKYDKSTDSYLHLLLKRSEINKLYPNVWQAITGTIELQETAIETSLRELKEETGLFVNKMWNLPYITQYYNVYNDSIGLSPCFGALVNSDSTVTLSEEHSEYRWCRYDEALDLLPLPTHKSALDIFQTDILNGKLGELYEIDLQRIDK